MTKISVADEEGDLLYTDTPYQMVEKISDGMDLSIA
jgi:hypothetical protein